MKKEIREKISKKMRGKLVDQTTRLKMSEGRKGIKSGRYEYEVHFTASTMKEIADILGFSTTMIKWCWRDGKKMDGHDITITRKERR